MLLRTKIRIIYKNKKDDISFLLSAIAFVLGIISFAGKWQMAILVIFIASLAMIYSFNNILKRLRASYYSVVYDEPNFYQWLLKVLKVFYQKDFVKIYGREFPCIVSLRGAFECRMTEGFYFKSKQDIRSICRLNLQQKGMAFWNRLKFRLIIEQSLSYPQIPGYMLDRLQSDRGIFVCKPGSYLQNCNTSLILEYELYLAFLEAKKISLNNFVDVPPNICQLLPIRMNIHRLCRKNGYDETTLGEGRMSLLSVQMMIIYFNQNGEPCTVMKKRAEDGLSYLPGHYQFVPAGGFELFEREKDCYNPNVIERGCDPQLALWREFLEELFNQQDFQGIYTTSWDNPRHKVESSYQVKYIKELILTKKAALVEAGSIMDLTTLRHTLSYILFIHEDNGLFEKEIVNRMSFNEEFSKDNSYCNRAISIKELEKIFKDGRMNFTPDAAGLYFIAPQIAKKYGYKNIF